MMSNLSHLFGRKIVIINISVIEISMIFFLFQNVLFIDKIIS